MGRHGGIHFTDPRHDGLGGDQSGVAQIILSPLESTGSGQIVISGIMAVSLSHIAAEGAGQSDAATLNGVASIVLGSLQAQGYGEAVGGTIEGQGSIEIGPISVTAIGSVAAQPIPIPEGFFWWPSRKAKPVKSVVKPIVIDGTAEIQLSAVVAKGSGNVAIPVINGTASASVAPLSVVGSGNVDTTIIDEDEEITLLVAALFARGRAA